MIKAPLGQFYHFSMEEFNELSKKANQGSAFHQNEFGKVLARSFFIPENKEKAAKYYQMAANQDYPEAIWNLGNYLLNDPAGPHDLARGLELLFRGRDLGDPLIINQLGFYYQHGLHVGQDYEKALELFRQAAELGNPHSQYNLAYMYLNGLGLEADSLAAFEWVEKAAEADFVEAIGSLGEFYLLGVGCKPDQDKGFELLNRAVGRDHAKSILLMGLIYKDSDLVEPDYQLARFYLHKAVNLGHLPAFPVLAELLEKGLGGAKDLQGAKSLYFEAARGALPGAAELYQKFLAENENGPEPRGSSEPKGPAEPKGTAEPLPSKKILH
ncbi:MAG: sel1 repeat family protein [Deltaproteobacteria bacterium]|jgi:TPR repeat protein|nr:sel1 repeat family protein [Deltaproteobacteria bacterium]